MKRTAKGKFSLKNISNKGPTTTGRGTTSKQKVEKTNSSTKSKTLQKSSKQSSKSKNQPVVIEVEKKKPKRYLKPMSEDEEWMNQQKTQKSTMPNIVDDKYARYGQYKPNNFTSNVYEQIEGNKKNKWAEVVRKQDYKYDSRYLDKDYLAYMGAKKGLIPYYGDFDGDGVPDSALVDKNMKLKQFNGYSQKRSKRPQYINFYEHNKPTGFSDNGFPLYADFDEYIDQYTDEIESKKIRENINKDLARNGFATYKVKEKTFNEIVSAAVRNEYKNKLNNYCQQLNVTPAYFKRILPLNTLTSLYIRSLLNALFNADPSATTDSDQGRWITKTINKKYPDNHQFAGFKQNLIVSFNQINNIIGQNLILTIFNLINKGYDNAQVLYNLVNLIKGEISNNQTLQNIANICRAAIQLRIKESKCAKGTPH